MLFSWFSCEHVEVRTFFKLAREILPYILYTINVFNHVHLLLQMRQVLYRDFEAGLQMIKPSVTENDLDLYIEWNKQFGCGQK